MSWINASLRGLLIVAYFVLATVIVPNLVLQIDALVGASDAIRDVVVLAVWGAGFLVGLWVLRRLQARGVI